MHAEGAKRSREHKKGVTINLSYATDVDTSGKEMSPMRPIQFCLLISVAERRLRMSQNPIFFFFVTFCVSTAIDARSSSKCQDTDMNCPVWVASNKTDCDFGELVVKHCVKSCQTCGPVVEPQYDVRRLPPNLKSVAWLVGRWRSEFGGKAFFPTIPKFTYGEQLDISIGEVSMGAPLLNYTAFAWDISMPEGDPIEIHSENGYISVRNDEKNGVDVVSLNTAMSNGFMTIEEGESGPNQIKFKLQSIGRISFSHDSAVRLMFREWTLLDESHLEARLLMTTTITRRLMEHTAIIYKKIYP
ncbi:unnamed protein product [Caenorhabditis auriculariae]|uniref:ShKT domain-containing protein n=1 Tax=Caenorhabditis auriculariae TaxID=2777116 RepID=A0A8S1HFP3_9PELO|nr:unnamed protein product [Caenorhabditis auriculariae]